jgi:hypothetical protein
MKAEIFIAIIVAIPFSIVGIFNLFNPPLNLFVLLIGPVVFALFYVYLFRNTVIIEEHTLKSTTFFTSSEIPYEDIQKAEIKLKIRGNPPYQMKIFHKNEQTSNPIVINIKLFSRKDLKVLARALAEKSPQADLDAAIKRMIDGQMPSFFRMNNGDSNR